MTFKMVSASTVAAAATLITAFAGALGSGAWAQDLKFVPIQMEPVTMISQPVVQPLPTGEQADDAAAPPTDAADASEAGSLAELVAAQSQPEELSDEMRCLAGAIYFEAKSESLPGQLAVGRVVVNRAKSGRFPASYCGVVYQPSQFSFVRGRAMPAIRTNSQDWRDAVAIAQIADADGWESQVEGALFFHATHVSPGWRLKRMARVDNHVFYR